MTHDEEVSHWKGLHMKAEMDCGNLREQVKGLMKERDEAREKVGIAIDVLTRLHAEIETQVGKHDSCDVCKAQRELGE